MSTLFRRSIGAVAAALCCLPLGAVLAQQADRDAADAKPAQAQKDAAQPNGPIIRALQNGRALTDRVIQARQPYAANYRGEQAGQKSAVENYLANCWLKNNQAEIELSKFAAQQSQNPQVKQFAEQLVQDHQKVAQQLEQLASANVAAKGTDSTSLDATTRTETASQATDSTPTPGSSATDTAPGIDANQNATSPRHPMMANAALNEVAQIEQKINDRCNQALREELQQKSGAEFDECFVGAQIAGHMHMLAALDVISQDTQGQLKQVADEAKPAVQKHLEHAKELVKQLKAGGQASAQGEQPKTVEAQQ